MAQTMADLAREIAELKQTIVMLQQRLAVALSPVDPKTPYTP